MHTQFTEFSRKNGYVLKADIRKYFASVDHEILLAAIARKIADERVLWLIALLVGQSNQQETSTEYFPDDDLFTPLNRRRGIPIGNLTSQFFANVYLNGFDHFVKEALGCRCYIRYVDDFAIFANDKQWLWKAKAGIEDYLTRHLRLRLHPRKVYVQPVATGTDFLGYRIYPTHRRLRRSNGVRFRRRLRSLQAAYRSGKMSWPEVKQRLASWNGHASHADTYRLRSALFDGAVFSRA